MRENEQVIGPGVEPTPILLAHLMKQMAFVVQQKEAQLQVEESGQTIAKLQGYLAGYRQYGTILMAAGFDFDYREDNGKEQPWVDDEDFPDYDDLTKIHLLNQTLQENGNYISLKSSLELKVEEKKDFLFYMSDKTRDMHWCKGWYEAASQVESWIETLENSYKLAQKMKEESLPFDD